MAIWLTKDSKVIVQGMTGAEGSKHTRRMLAAGTNVVGGVNPRKAGTRSTSTARSCRCSAASPRRWRRPAPTSASSSCRRRARRPPTIEAIDAQIPLAVVITEGVPVHDTANFWAHVRRRATRPGSSGRTAPASISPGKSNAGIIPADITGPGRIGLVSKSGTLTYQMMYELRDIGFSTCVGIGGDPVIGTTHIDALAAFEADPETDGDRHDRRDRRRRRGACGDFIKANVTKPVVGYVAGFTAPEGKTMGHAGAIVSGSSGTAAAKKEALEAVGVKVGKTPTETANLMRDLVKAL